MTQYPLPPGFDRTLAERSARRARRRRRRMLIGGALAVLLVGGGATSWALRGGDGDDAAAGARDCTEPATELVVASSADKAALLTRFGADFSAVGRTAAGQCVTVSVVKKASGAAARALVKGWTEADGKQPDVWSPTGSIWLPLLEEQLTKAQRSSLIPAPEAVPKMAASPMVVAMPRPMAEALGWPDKALGWSDLLSLAASQTGWADFGHPEWGRFTLGKTNPNFSHAGLEGTIATYYAGSGKTSALTEQDVADAATRRFVAGVEQSVLRYGDNTVTFQSDWLRADRGGQAMSYISALVTEENMVPAYNDGNPTADPDQLGRNQKATVPLVAIYPKEGTFVADHPYAVLSAPWVTDAKREAAQAFLDYLLSEEVQTRWQDNFFRDAKNRAGAKATEAVGVLPDQPGRVLEPPSPAVTDAILQSWSELRKTANVINLIDVSGSMKTVLPGEEKTKLDAAKAAVKTSLGLFTDADEVGLWSFSGGVRGQIDYQELVAVGPMKEAVGGAVRRDALASAVDALKAKGDTGLYNSIDAAYQAVLDRYQEDRINAVVVLTDGKNDAEGGLTLDQLIERLTGDGGGKVRIITIAYGPDADEETLATIARATKGASYVAPTTADIPKVYSAALSNLSG